MQWVTSRSTSYIPQTRSLFRRFGCASCLRALPSGRVLGANDRLRIGLIGGGDRGQEIFRAALKCPNVEGVAVADLYTRRLDEVKQFAPGIQTYNDFRGLPG